MSGVRSLDHRGKGQAHVPWDLVTWPLENGGTLGSESRDRVNSTAH